jgi:hypothetical protein
MRVWELDARIELIPEAGGEEEGESDQEQRGL